MKKLNFAVPALLMALTLPAIAQSQNEPKIDVKCAGTEIGAYVGGVAGATTGAVVGGVTGATLAGGVGILCSLAIGAAPFTAGLSLVGAVSMCGAGLLVATAVGAGVGAVGGGIGGAVGGKELGKLADGKECANH